MKTAVIGLGLIGGSMAKAFKDNTDSEVYGLDINASVMLKAKLVGAIDGELTDDILAQCDRVIIALSADTRWRASRDGGLTARSACCSTTLR